ncbi:MAG: transporter substrate-binding domain-containing protein [Chlamydiae bacterium]|nr:transporter substrate-binding domain-containing protein [Chlamydiota bacterium]
MKKVIIIFLACALISAPFARHFFLKAFPPKDTNTLIVGTNAEYAPFAYIENNEIIGFDIDVAKEIAIRMHKNIKIIDLPFDSLVPAALVGKVQIIAAGMTFNEERAKKVIFTKPYIEGDPFMIITKDGASKVTNLNDLKGKKVIVNEGYTADLYLSSQNVEGIDVVRLNSPSDGFTALACNRADAFITSNITVNYFFKINGMNKQNFAFTPITDPKAFDSYSVVVSPKHSILLNDVEKILEDLKNDGTLEALKKKWGI